MELKIYRINSSNNTFIYHPSIQSLFRVSPIVADILADFHNEMIPIAEISAKHGNPFDNIKEMVDEFDKHINNVKTTLIERQKNHRDSIEIKMDVAHYCNLKCIYCYSNDGTYGLKGKMSVDTAISTVNFFESKLQNADVRLTFFGGEPFLNIPVIEKVCKVVTTLKSANNNSYSLGVITNGTVISDEIIELLNKYNIAITISIDGPREVHDFQRKFKNGGTGSFDTICENIKFIQERCKIPIYFEATYTSIHEKFNLPREDVVKYLKGELGFHGGIITNVNPFTKQLQYLEPKNYTVESCLATLEQGRISDWAYYPFLYLINRLFPTLICGIGVTHFVVVPNGDIYPCQLFVGDKTFVIGNVNSQQFNKSAELLSILNKEKNPRCKNCWAKWLCKGCPGNLYKREHRLFYTEEECINIRKNLERLLARIGDIRCDEARYRRLIEIIKERNKQMELI